MAWFKPAGFALLRWGTGAAGPSPALVPVGVTAVWERVMKGKRGQKGQADAQRGSGGLVGATKASTGYTRYSGLVVWLSGGFGGLWRATFL